ncbi:hypothetical protein QQ045_001219 [Rhodiola kirilowii]
MISSAVYGGGTVALIAPMTHRPSRSRSIFSRSKLRAPVCYHHHQNHSGVGDLPEHKTLIKNPVILKLRRKVEEDEEEEEEKEVESQVEFKQMLSFCGLGYWVSGFRCFPWLALNIHMAQNLNMHPSTLQMVQNSGNLPMVAKPIYGVISDALYIGGAHRIPYVCIGVLLQILAWAPLASVTTKEASLGLRKPADGTGVASSVSKSIRTQFSDFTVAVKDERISRPLIWIAGSIAMIPILSGSIFCYQTQCLHINPFVPGMSKVIGQLLLLSLTVLYDRFLKNMSMRKLVSSLQFSYALALLLDLVLVKQINIKLGIPNELYVLCVSGLAETIAQLKTLPFTVLLANLCPPGCEGSLTSFMAQH